MRPVIQLARQGTADERAYNVGVQIAPGSWAYLPAMTALEISQLRKALDRFLEGEGQINPDGEWEDA